MNEVSDEEIISSTSLMIVIAVLRPNLLALPFPILASIFVMSQNINFTKVCRLLRLIGRDHHVRAQYLEYQHQIQGSGSFFVRMLKRVPPVENARLWIIFLNRKVFSSISCT
jgi:hypothetical protein